ncbi:AAA family ATPase [Nocardia sp. NRRL S-836]|uniref:AAA family ATPase n=1 Tax=Nocardia sp. NRRL S-836 TaxID=1519492 RepID=UPI000AF3E7A2|nr:AAA family ATPase [Nocardia sp. NRRL S-836]
MFERIHPTDVFTPNRFPLQKHNVYAARRDAEASIRSGLARAQAPVLYGEYGVGKTTLVKRYFYDRNEGGIVIEFLTPAGKGFDDVVKAVLEKLDYEVVVSRENKATVSATGESDVSFFGMLKAKIKLKGESTGSERLELVVSSPTDQGFLHIAADAKVTIVIDEMHKSSPSFRQQLAEMIKAANNLGEGYARFVLIGTTLDASKLVDHDAGIDRLIREVKLSVMTEEESRFIITDGMKRLGVSISEELINRIVSTAAGAPSLLQEICLDVAELAVTRDEKSVKDDDVDQAIRNFVLNSEARLTRRYMLATNTVGVKQYRKQILKAAANLDREFFTMDDLTSLVSQYVGEDVPASSLSGPLRELKDSQYGSVLTDVETPVGGRAYNLNAFKDPRMKAFIRAMNAVEEQGLLPTVQEVETLPPYLEEVD